MPRRRKAPPDVFLNIPYDEDFENLFLAYISGISALGLVPRATLEISGGQRRLDRILALIQRCQYTVHDLSRVKIDTTNPPTPRFNMPFELGLSVAWEKATKRKNTWFVFESKEYRLEKSLSDLKGTDAYIHHGKITGVFRELCNSFFRAKRQPTVQQMKTIYRNLKRLLPKILRQAGGQSLYSTRVFKEICVLAIDFANQIVD